MENEITGLENMNRQLECRGTDYKNKFYSTLEEKLISDKEYEQYINDRNDIIERLTFELDEIKREVETKDEIIHKLKRQVENNEIKTSIFNNNEEDFSDNNISLTPLIHKRNSHTRLSKALLNIENLDNMNSNNNNIKNEDKNPNNNDNSNSHNEYQDREKTKEKTNLNNNSINNLELNDNNKSLNLTLNNNHNTYNNILNSKNNKSNNNFNEDEIHELNIQAIAAKIDDVLNNSHILDKSAFNQDKHLQNIVPQNKDNVNNNTVNNSLEENEEKEFIRQIIDQEVKNILENRKAFILNTLTQENFSFDLINTKSSMIGLDNNIKKKLPNKAKIIENIDDILVKIQARREKVLMQKKLMINKLEKMGIKIF